MEDEEEVEDMVTETHVSTMMVKGSSPERSLRNISATKDEADINPEDFECSSHQISVLEGMNELRLKGHLLDVTLWAENKAFQVSNNNHMPVSHSMLLSNAGNLSVCCL